MKKIKIELTFDWDDYDDVSDELMIEDSGIYDGLKTGVSIKIIKNEKDSDKS